MIEKVKSFMLDYIRTRIRKLNGPLFSRLAALFVLFPASGFAAAANLNVLNFGAKGDAVQFWVGTTSNSVVVTTTNQLSSADIGKTMELFRVGTQTTGINFSGVQGTNNQDMIAVITNVVGGTNVFLSLPCQVTTNAFATYGTDNTPAFSNAIAACSGYTDATINIPDGKYLFMPTFHNSDGYAYASVIIRRGGLHLVGQSQTNTILLSRGAWMIKNTQNGTPWDGSAFRGFLFQICAPITNDYPLSIENLTMDGGVLQGNTPCHGISVNPVDGNGWDQQHSAYLTIDKGNGNCSGTVTHQILTNVTLAHWRGEIVKSIDMNTNGNIAIYNCSFLDGNATALNIYPTLDCRYCLFSNLFQVAEIYQLYYRSPAYFMNNFVTNITGNGWAWNGGVWSAPSFTMQSNTFYFNGYGQNAIQTLPAANIYILNNQIHCAAYMSVFVIGAMGSQGTVENSNIVISGNSVYADAANFTYPGIQGILSKFVTCGGPGITGVAGLTVFGNTVTASTVNSVVQQGSNATAVRFSNNAIIDSTASFDVSSGNPMVLIETNNTYTPFNLSGTLGSNNLVSYGSGPLKVSKSIRTGMVFVLQDSNSNQIPAGAWMKFDNRGNTQGSNYTVYLSQSMGNSVTVTSGQVLSLYWNNGGWTTTNPQTLLPPTNLRILPAP